MNWPILLGGGAVLLVGGLAAFSGATAKKLERAVPRDGKLLKVGSDTLHYVDKGSGPPIVMIHGLGGQLRNFAASLVDDLARDHRVILVDRPGSGYSVRGPGSSARLHAQADTIAAFIAALGLDRPLLVGHSLGGALSLAVAVRHPEVAGGLALVAPLTQDQDQADVPPVFKGLVIRNSGVRKAVGWTLAVPMGMAKAEEALREVFAPDPVPENFGVDGGGFLAMRPSNFIASSADICELEGELPGMVERYPSIAIPVAILYGRGDNLLAPALHGEKTASQIPGARLTLTEGGHMLPFTDPATTLAFVRAAADRTFRRVPDAAVA
jgi:pimeloyl-ACP methyl ester carboxylesterase